MISDVDPSKAFDIIKKLATKKTFDSNILGVEKMTSKYEENDLEVY